MHRNDTGKDRTMTTGHMHKKFGKVWFRRYACGQTGRQTDTQKYSL